MARTDWTRRADCRRGQHALTFRPVTGGQDSGPGTAGFTRAVEQVRAYVRREPGAWSALAELSRTDPEGTTRSLLALGTVLLDVAAAAFEMTPDEMLVKVSTTVDLARLEDSRRADSR
jgi:hypothetical protein